MKDHCTLYVGKLPTERRTAAVVRRHFGEFGPIERLNFLEDRGVAFIRYAHRYFAEFAKEAMSNQALDEQEIINVRWATEDPNPRAKADMQRRQEEMARQAIELALEEAAQGRKETEESQKRLPPLNGEGEEGERKRIKGPLTEGIDGSSGGKQERTLVDGIFSAEALQSLQSMVSTLHARPAPSSDTTSEVKKTPVAMSGSLVSTGYDESDEED